MSDHALPLRLLDENVLGDPSRGTALVESYRRLADVFHDVLAEQSLDALLDRIADALAELVPHDSLTIYEADESRRLLLPVWARDKWADKILADSCPFGVGLTGWGVEHRESVRVNQAHLDPRTSTVPGTPEDEPEALITIPLIARDSIKGALNIYRLGDDASFDDDEFELAKRFGDAAALALDNAQIRARLEHQAQTDPLTGLFNHRAFHERLRQALAEASRSHDVISLLMLDIDDFKRVNDVYGHGAGDEILRSLADTLKDAVRASDVVYRLGGEEFAIVIASRSPESAEQLANRLVERVESTEFNPAGRITISVGLARGPEHAMNPRELIACAEAAMMTAKARGKNQIVLYDDAELERPEGEEVPSTRDVRSVAHMKMLQSLGGKLNRLNDVRQIGHVIATELRSLIDYHNCRVSIVDGDDVIPIAFVGQFTSETQEPLEILACKVGQGITGRVAATGESLLIADAANCEFARVLPGTDAIDESQVVVPLVLRDACRRRDRDLQARPQPVRRGRHAPPRSARRPRRCCARERRSLRIRPAGSRPRDRAARIQPPALECRRHGCGRRPHRRAVGPHRRLASRIGLVPGGCKRRDQSAGDPRLQRPRPRAPGADAFRP